MKVSYETLYKTFLKDKGKEPKNSDQLCKYCRKLIEAGTDPKTKLEVVRADEVLVFSVSEIGLIAKIAIKENEDIGPVYRKYTPMSVEKKSLLRNRMRSKGVTT